MLPNRKERKQEVSSAVKEPKFRHELKYLCSAAELKMLEVRLQDVMRPDPHTDETGCYLIRSTYFDDLYDRCLNENESGVSPREKWRVRIYNCSDRRISLECKRKEYGMIQKKSCRITRDQYERMARLEPVPIGPENPPLLNRMLLQQRTQLMQPKVIVQYLRRPFVCDEGNVRVTFDMNITSSQSFDRFFEKDIWERPVLPKGQHLLEVKFDEYLPDYIYHAIQMTNMRLETFSKYYLCRQYNLQGFML
ncbi:MAG: polyphosphate polymerase domain-containing protein [Lachnospiraceae bacterium]|nr:polyphosphate polymerase domain-containing protein [Sarcina sp.]MBR2728777.1 polyphosphate polymerase domain-containing protein [Lachnospiraceae bacterium]